MKISHNVRVLLTALLVVAMCLSIVPVVAMAAQSTRANSEIEFPSNNPNGPADEEEGDIKIPIGSLPTVPPTEPSEPSEPTEPAGVPGDFTGDDTVTNDDVITLLWHCLFPKENPLEISGDLTGDDTVTNDDVIKLLWHCLFPEENPL